jgi:EAL domain-containing protein (putative c-di-GMP-specific phosphodiesterase class I)
MEVLARWTLPDGTAVAPLRFVQMAEEIGAGSTLGRLVLDRALDALVRWRAAPVGGDGRARPSVDFVSVNLSRSQLEDPDFVTQVAGQLAARDLEPSVLMIEVGTAAYVDSLQARSTLGMLKALGVRLALDDFGTEGVSLAGLQALPIEGVKVDPRLTTALGRDDTLVASLTALCRSLGLRCSAEGIETEEQLEAARALGFDTVQGYLLGRPAGALDAAAYLSGPGAATAGAGR